MVVVADPQLRQALSRALTNHGYEPSVCRGAGSAVEFAAQWGPQLCVVDQAAGDPQTKSDITRLLDQSPDARFVILADDVSDVESACRRARRCRLLLRPFSMLEFIAAIDDALHQSTGPDSNE